MSSANASSCSATSATTTLTTAAAPAALPSSFTVHLAPVRPRLRWAEDTVDNEHMGKRSSKKCCIFHKRRAFGESSSDEESGEDDAAGGSKKRAQGAAEGRGGAGSGASKPASSGDAVEFDPECDHCTQLAALRAGTTPEPQAAAEQPPARPTSSM